MRQIAREKVLDKFRKGNIEILVATDVAARGLDVENIEAVFNYDMPQDEESYVHRIGRTGRAGKTGKAFTFVTGRELFKLRVIQKYIKTKIKLLPVPSYDDVEEMRTTQFLDEIRNTINAGSLNKYIHIVERLVNDEFSSLDIAAALVKLKIETENPQEDLEETRERKGRDSNKGRDSGQVRLFINIGKKDNARPGDLLGAIAGETGIPGKVIGEIAMYDKFSFINVPSDYADEIIDGMSGVKIKGRKVNLEIANRKGQ